MAKLKLEGIEKLYRDMQIKNIDRQKFDYKYNSTEFDIILFTDETPFKLMFGVKRKNFYFEMAVMRGFVIETYLDDIYSNLCKALDIHYDPINKFKPIEFFKDFDDKVPNYASVYNRPKAQDIVKYKSDVEEADKIYFCGWKDNNVTGNKVQDINLDKTRKLLGEKAYISCMKRNISSCWTDDATKEKEYTIL